MNNFVLRGLLAFVCLVSFAAVGFAQSPAQQTFPSADAAATSLTEAIRHNDDNAVASILGKSWREFVPGTKEDEDDARTQFLAAWDESHKLVPADNNRMLVEVGKSGFVMPIPIVQEGTAWHFDVVAGKKEVDARTIGRNELTVVQTLLAISDAQHEYAERDPMKTGVATYARRMKSTPGKKDGLYWEVKPGEPQSPLGSLVAKAQPGDGGGNGYYGYHFRLLYRQGPAAVGGAYDYVVDGRMIGGFAAIAWPVRYGETGVMTFIVSHSGDVYEQDLGPETSERAAAITSFNPDKDWEKSDMTPP
jgi:hypothetical protein